MSQITRSKQGEIQLTRMTSMPGLFSRLINQAEGIKVMIVIGKAATVRPNSTSANTDSIVMSCTKNPAKKKKSNLRMVV